MGTERSRKAHGGIGERNRNTGSAATHDFMEEQRRGEHFEYDTIIVAESRSAGMPTPTPTLSSAGGGGDGRECGSGSAGDVYRRSRSDDGVSMDMATTTDSGDTAVTTYRTDTSRGGGRVEGAHANADATMGEGGTGVGTGGAEATQGIMKMRVEEGGQSQTPVWSETKTKAGKARKRLPLACIACRRKKIRCSGEIPACSHCIRSRIPCVYKQSTRKTAPRSDYMAMLDRRLKRMEERLIKHIPKHEINSLLLSTGRSIVKPNLTSHSAKSIAVGKKRAADAAFENELEKWAHSSNPPKQRNCGAAASGGSWSKVAGGEGDMSNGDDCDDGSGALPSKEIQEHLSEVFFDYLYGQPYFLLHKPSFMRRLRSGTAPPVLVLAVCAVSARFSKHPAVRHDPPFLAGENFAMEARRQLLKNFDNPNVTNVAVCVMLGLHEFGTCQGGRSWAFGGMATRMAHALELHKEVNNDPLGKVVPTMQPDPAHEGEPPETGMSFIDREIRRRSMWSCFVMDRLNSSGTARPCVVSEPDLEIQLPVDDRNLELDNPCITERLDGKIIGGEEQPNASKNMGVAGYMIRAIALYGRVVKYINQGGKENDPREMWDPASRFAELESATSEFASALPDRLRYTPENLETHKAGNRVGQFIILSVTLQQIRLFLHRSALPATGAASELPSNLPREFAQSAGEIALSAATEISNILNDVQERGISVVAPFTGYCAFNASLVHLVRMFSPRKDVQAEAKKHTMICFRFLMQLRQYWGLFCSITDNLKMLYRKFLNAGTSMVGHQDASRILQYGDWFQKYPQGVPSGDYENNTTNGSTKETKISGEDAALSQGSDLQTADAFFAKLGLTREKRPPPRPTPAPPAKQPKEPLHPHQSQPHTQIHQPAPPHPPLPPPPPLHPLQTQLPTPSSYSNPSPAVHNSPVVHVPPPSIHHSMSPAFHSPGMQSSPSTTTSHTPSTITENGDLNPRLDPRILNTSAPPHDLGRTAIYPGNFQQPNSSQHSISSHLPNMSSPVSYPNYPAAVPPSSENLDNVAHMQHHPNNPYLYDSYPAGSDQTMTVAATGSLNALWTGFDQQMNTPSLEAFNGSAWFLPFNQCPPEFDNGGVDNMGIFGGSESGEGSLGSGGGVPCMMSGPGISSSPVAYRNDGL